MIDRTDNQINQLILNDINFKINLESFILKNNGRTNYIIKIIEVYEKLSEYFLLNIKDEQIIKDFKFLCQQFAPFWKNVE